MKSTLLLTIIACVLFSCACKKDPTIVSNICDKQIIIDSKLYNNGDNDPLTIKDIKLDGDCLDITYSYGGGCADVQFNLVCDGAIMESMPLQTNVRVNFRDKDNCKALITTTESIDLTPLKKLGTPISFKLKGWETRILYE